MPRLASALSYGAWTPGLLPAVLPPLRRGAPDPKHNPASGPSPHPQPPALLLAAFSTLSWPMAGWTSNAAASLSSSTPPVPAPTSPASCRFRCYARTSCPSMCSVRRRWQQRLLVRPSCEPIIRTVGHLSTEYGTKTHKYSVWHWQQVPMYNALATDCYFVHRHQSDELCE